MVSYCNCNDLDGDRNNSGDVDRVLSHFVSLNAQTRFQTSSSTNGFYGTALRRRPARYAYTPLHNRPFRSRQLSNLFWPTPIPLGATVRPEDTSLCEPRDIVTMAVVQASWLRFVGGPVRGENLVGQICQSTKIPRYNIQKWNSSICSLLQTPRIRKELIKACPLLGH